MDNGIVPTLPLNNNGGFADAGEWIFGLIVLAMFANGGLFGGNNRDYATTDFVSSQFTQRDISQLGTEVNNGFQNTNNLVSAGFGRTNDNLSDVRTSVIAGDMGISNQVLENRYANQLSACQTQRDILTQTNELNTNMLTSALQNQAKVDECCCSIKNAIREDGEATRALITANTIQDLRDRLTDAQNTITANGIGSTIINSVRPYPVPSYMVSSPYQSIYNGFYGSNWYGNTIV